MTKLFKTLTPDECQNLLTWLLETDPCNRSIRKRTRDYCFCLLFLDAGLRVGEASQLVIGDLWLRDEPVKSLIVRPAIAKRKRERTLPLTLRLRQSITEMHKQNWHWHSDLLQTPAFTRYLSKEGLSIRRMQQIIAYASEQSIGRKISPHLLRHTFATRLMVTTNIRIVQELLGHASLQSTQIYTHPNHHDLDKAITALQLSEQI